MASSAERAPTVPPATRQTRQGRAPRPLLRALLTLAVLPALRDTPPTVAITQPPTTPVPHVLPVPPHLYISYLLIDHADGLAVELGAAVGPGASGTGDNRLALANLHTGALVATAPISGAEDSSAILFAIDTAAHAVLVMSPAGGLGLFVAFALPAPAARQRAAATPLQPLVRVAVPHLISAVYNPRRHEAYGLTEAGQVVTIATAPRPGVPLGAILHTTASDTQVLSIGGEVVLDAPRDRLYIKRTHDIVLLDLPTGRTTPLPVALPSASYRITTVEPHSGDLLIAVQPPHQTTNKTVADAVMRVSPTSGQVRWRTRVTYPLIHGAFDDGLNDTALDPIHHRLLYWVDGLLRGLELDTGALLYTRPVAPNAAGVLDPALGLLLYAPQNSPILTLDDRTGRIAASLPAPQGVGIPTLDAPTHTVYLTLHTLGTTPTVTGIAVIPLAYRHAVAAA